MSLLRWLGLGARKEPDTTPLVKELTTGSELLAALHLDRSKVRGFILNWEEEKPVTVTVQYYADPTTSQYYANTSTSTMTVYTYMVSDGGPELLAALDIATINIKGFTLRYYVDEPVTIIVENYAALEKVAALTTEDRLAKGFSIRCDRDKSIVITNEMFLARERTMAALDCFFDKWLKSISEKTDRLRERCVNRK